MAFSIPFNLLGIDVAGDIDGVTTYTDRFGQKVFYKKSPPDTPPTIAQINQRSRFRLALDHWRLLTAEQRKTWERFAVKMGLIMTGHNYFLSLHLRKASREYQTANAVSPSGLPLPCKCFTPQ